MKKLYIIANWKANHTSSDIELWFQSITQERESISTTEKEIIVCPPFPYLALSKTETQKYTLPILLGAQNIAAFEKGAYTGEVVGKQIKEFAQYVLIGHSERRKLFAETDESIKTKVEQAISVGLIPIVCVQDSETPVPQGVTIVAYEPVSAIGTGHPDTPDNADEVARKIRENHNNISVVLYGGSVTGENVSGFTSMPHISGVLVGSASLDGIQFAQIIKNA
jgi:triosephosphate isomerase (TIM)